MTRELLRWRENYNFICKFWLRARQWQNKLSSVYKKLSWIKALNQWEPRKLSLLEIKVARFFICLKLQVAGDIYPDHWTRWRPVQSEIRQTKLQTATLSNVQGINQQLSIYLSTPFIFRAPIPLRNVLQNDYHFPVSHFEIKFYPSLTQARVYRHSNPFTIKLFRFGLNQIN